MPPFDIESPSAFQAPGDVVYYRPAKEFAVASPYPDLKEAEKDFFA